MGGAGSAVNEYIISQGLSCRLLNLGLPDIFIEHGAPEILLADYGLNAEGICTSITHFCERHNIDVVNLLSSF